jgi:hypothetical protein
MSFFEIEKSSKLEREEDCYIAEASTEENADIAYTVESYDEGPILTCRGVVSPVTRSLSIGRRQPRCSRGYSRLLQATPGYSRLLQATPGYSRLGARVEPFNLLPIVKTG